ncbi:MAG: polyketide synthase dehydratase domain-containing protein [Verrucomicrobiales bacterium]|nr:polyketide synthase dehydratase domain-containing protein [Verrucomicrobiales bacterium]
MSKESELFLFSAESREELLGTLSAFESQITAGHGLRELANHSYQSAGHHFPRLAIIAADSGDLQTKVSRAIDKLSNGHPKITDTSGVYFTETPINANGQAKVGFLFPGEGSQYPGMLSGLLEKFPELNGILEECDTRNDSSAHLEKGFTRFFQAVETLTTEELSDIQDDLKRIDHAMFAILIADWMMFHTVCQLGIRPDTIAGHSGGELIALMVSQVLTGPDEQFHILCEGFRELGKFRPEGAPESRLLAIGKPAEFAAQIIDRASEEQGREIDAYVAMKNCPHQTVIVGTRESIDLVEKLIVKKGVIAQPLSIEQPYHTPLFAPYMSALRRMFEPLSFHPVDFPVYSCTTAELFPPDPEQIFELTAAHWECPVEFIQLIENQYRDGVRCFIEIGPRNHLSSFTDDILRSKKDTLVVPSNTERSNDFEQLQHLTAQLYIHGFTVDPSCFFDTTPAVAQDSKEAILTSHFEVMEEFLNLQHAVMNQYLSGTQPGPEPETFEEAPRPYPMVDEIVELVGGHRIVTRRTMLLEEDLFSDQHTVGGRDLSQVNPEQHGLPLVPMTFSIEMLAESAKILFPELVVTAMSRIKLYKWLDYSETGIANAQVVAELNAEKSTPDRLHLEAKVYHWKGSEGPDLKRPAATAVIELSSAFPAPPHSDQFAVSNERPCGVTPAQLYQNLFHGEVYQGVFEMGKFGDEGIEAQIGALPREALYRSNPDPKFVYDPVLLDVSLHPMCAWHLEQEDQSGRILLPIGVDRIEFFGNCPEPGTPFISRAKLVKETSRQFTQQVDVIDGNGQVWCKMIGSQYWRFYLPFRKFNFHGPKNIYMLSLDFEIPSHIGTAKILEIPEDLRNPVMQPIGAKVTLSESEYSEFQKLELPADRISQWLFGRITAKEAVREKWSQLTGEALYTADVIIEHTDKGRPVATKRGSKTPENFPHITLSHCGNTVVAIASDIEQVGVDIEKIVPREKSFLKIAFSPAELEILSSIDPEMLEWPTRFWSAKEAVGKALGTGLEDGPRSVEVIAVDQPTGVVTVKLANRPSPGYLDKGITVYTTVSDDMAIAYTICETLENAIQPDKFQYAGD